MSREHRVLSAAVAMAGAMLVIDGAEQPIDPPVLWPARSIVLRGRQYLYATSMLCGPRK